MSLKKISHDEPGYRKPLPDLIDSLAQADTSRRYGYVVITVEDLEDAIYYLQEMKDEKFG